MRICPTCRFDYSDEVEFCPRDTTPLPFPVAAAQPEATASGLSQRYRIVRKLGEGGMGTVFLAEQIALGNRPVALKVLRRGLLADPDFLQRFREEAASTGRIRHQNVVTVYESGQADDGSPYIAMEYLEGQTLGQTLKQSGALSLAATADVLQQVARGLHAAHKLGIIHRDVKPDNIFLTRNDEGSPMVKVVDFGIAKMRESSTHTMTGLAIGTPAYISPEQAQGMRSEELDGRSDLYSLGIVAYEMLSGRVPFEAETPLAYVRQHLTDAPPPLQTIRPGLQVPPVVEQVVLKALAKDRSQRYQSTLEFAHDFSRAVEPPQQVVVDTAPLQVPRQPEAVPAPAVLPSPLPAPGRRSSARPLLVAALVMLVAAAAGASMWYMQSRPTVRVGDWALLANGQPARDYHYVGACPVDLAFRWDAVGSRPTAMSYFVTRSDGFRSPASRMVQLQGGNEVAPVVEHWQLGDAPGTYSGWMQMNTETPNVVASKIPFSVQCQAAAAAVAVKKPTPGAAAPVAALQARVTPPAPVKQPGVESAKTAIEQGDHAYSEGDYDQAIAEYRKGLVADPGSAELQARLASAQTAKGAKEQIGIAPAARGRAAESSRASVAVSGTTFLVNGHPLPSHLYDGPCPVDLSFQWEVVGTEGTQVVYYTSRSDGVRSSTTQTMSLPHANQAVPLVQHWVFLSRGPIGSYGGWVQLFLESPTRASSKIPFAIHCR
ncbi:MAG TPA: protein kinase [Acidobacteriaceae bacterium]